jgi:hypothetical protein
MQRDETSRDETRNCKWMLRRPRTNCTCTVTFRSAETKPDERRSRDHRALQGRYTAGIFNICKLPTRRIYHNRGTNGTIVPNGRSFKYYQKPFSPILAVLKPLIPAHLSSQPSLFKIYKTSSLSAT